MIGWYTPNVAGARTINEAEPLTVGGELVRAQVYKPAACDQHFIAIFVGIDLVHESHLPLEVEDERDVNPYIQHFIAEYVA